MTAKPSSVEELRKLFNVSLRSSRDFYPKPSLLTDYPAENRQQAADLTGTLLAINHLNHHCFFNQRRFHNHIAHHLLALYALGANPTFIQSSYDREAPIQQPIGGQDKERITIENWTSFVGEKEYYGNYLKFFLEEIHKTSAIDVVQKFVFQTSDGQMFSRSFAGLLHPLIHWGYGLEFKIDGIVAEGLAMTAVHRDTFEALRLTELLEKPSDNGDLQRTSKEIGHDINTSFDFRCEENEKKFRPKSGLTAFEIIHKISQDDALRTSNFHLDVAENQFSETPKSKALHSWLDQWKIEDDCDWKEILERTKELLWMVTVLYMATYDQKKKTFMLNFFLMHLVTSSLFLPTILPIIDHQSRPKLLKAFFKTAITVWVACERPPLQLSQCLNEPSYMEVPHSQHPLASGNPWFKVLESAARHPDEHATKIIRSFSFNAKTYGDSQPGYYSCNLEGSELLDSTIFLRASIMTLGKLDWERKENESENKWFG